MGRVLYGGFTRQVHGPLMLHVLACLTQQHDPRFVVLAVFICGFAAWSAVSLMSRARQSSGRARRLWVLSAGLVFGTGSWATHYVSMLAYKSSMQIGYDLVPTVLSILAAVPIATAGFALVLRPRGAVLGGMLLGLAVCAMHYIGMQAMEGPFVLDWNWYYVAASLVVGVTLTTLAALAGVSIRNIRGRAMASGLLALSVFSLHFTAVSAVTLIPDPKVFYDDIVIAPGTLAIAIAAATLLIVALGLVAALLDNHLTLRRTDEAFRLRAHIAELEATQRALEKTSEDLTIALSRASAASNAKSTFLAAMSHELRTPLNAVIGFSELMLSETSGALENTRHREYVTDIRNSGVHLLDLINDVLDLSKLDSGKEHLREEKSSLNLVLIDALQMIEPQANSANVRLIADVPASLPLVYIDARRIGQVFFNVLSNAVKFTPAGGNIRVSVQTTREGLHVIIADTGIGIAQDDIQRAFERFGQVDSRLSRKYEGTGLGLPLAKQLIELHGGTLALRSEPNVGTTVTISFPNSRLVRSDAMAAA